MPGKMSSETLALYLFAICVVRAHVVVAAGVPFELRCGTIDIRNNVNLSSSFLYDDMGRRYPITDCTVVEGNLKVSLTTDSNITAEVFPVFHQLHEITGYMFIFQANGLDRLGRMFPKLRVIRGNNMFLQYALVVYQNIDLKEIGLSNLVEISKGGVRITENPNLCFSSSINWKQLIRSKRINGVLVRQNNARCMSEFQCRNSPAFDDNLCTTVENNAESNVACWNSKDCQKACNNCSNSCVDGSATKCCHDVCMGGCRNESATGCHACRFVQHNGRCQPHCPKGTYPLYPFYRRCVNRTTCINRSPFVNVAARNPKKFYWKVVQGNCTYICPPGFTESDTNRSKCERCATKCPVRCQTDDHSDGIASIDDAKRVFQGCEIVEGNVLLTLHDAGNVDHTVVVDELTTAMGSIVEITGHLRVFFSHLLLSLSFFKNLNIIHGRQLYNRRYAISVFENENLQSLFGNRIIQVGNGTAQFHNNPLLCYATITKTLDAMYLQQNYTKEDVSSFSNGNRAICAQVKIELSVVAAVDDIILLSWSGYTDGHTADSRKFLGYQVFYRVVDGPNGKIDIAAGRDLCEDSWKMKFMPADSESAQANGATGKALSGVKPNTWYAIYVKTLLISHPMAVGGISEIVYTKTAYAVPSPPRVTSSTATPTSIRLAWDPPDSPNGDITHYVISWRKVKQHDNGRIEQSCISGADKLLNKMSEKKTKDDVDVNRISPVNSELRVVSPTVVGLIKSKDDQRCEKESCCACKEIFGTKVISPEERKRSEEQWNFENFIQNAIFVQYSEHKNANFNESSETSKTFNSTQRVKRMTLDTLPANNGSTFDDANATEHMNRVVDDSLKPKSINVSDRFINIPHLLHFTDYEIKISACQNLSAPINFCSELPYWSIQRTMAIPSKDIVNASTIVMNRTDKEHTRRLLWEIPKEPNGIVLSFLINMTEKNHNKNTNSILEEETRESAFKPMYPECVTVKELKRDDGFVLEKIPHGDWLLTISTLTLRGKSQSSLPFSLRVVDERSSPSIALFVLILFALSAIIGAVVTIFVYKTKAKKVLANIRGTCPDYIPTAEIYEPDQWELQREDIILKNEFGRGSFAKVFSGRGKDNAVRSQCGAVFGDCAVKMVVEENSCWADHMHFLIEASAMKSFRTTFVVKLYGVVSNGQPALVVMEMMHGGNLRDYLRSCRPDAEENVNGLEPPTLQQALIWAAQIADGMCYLETQKFCHRDLATRNCMLSKELVAKIGDFGMARDVYTKDYYRPTGKRLMPVRWMAPEALMDAKSTSKSDVWSYGVVLWELVTLAQQPYPGIGNSAICDFVAEHRRTMERPRGCPEIIYNLMSMCWKYDPRERPTFDDLVNLLLPFQDDEFKIICFTCNRNAKRSSTAHHHTMRSHSLPDPDDDSDAAENPVCSNNRRKPSVPTCNNLEMKVFSSPLIATNDVPPPFGADANENIAPNC